LYDPDTILRSRPTKTTTIPDEFASLTTLNISIVTHCKPGRSGLRIHEYEGRRIVALNTLGGDLKREIPDLKDMFMGEITNFREECGEKIFAIHQSIEDLQADVALCKWSVLAEVETLVILLQSCMLLNQQSSYVKDITALSWGYRYGDIERGWAKTDLERRGVQDLATDISHDEALIVFSTRKELSKRQEQNVNHEKAMQLKRLNNEELAFLFSGDKAKDGWRVKQSGGIKGDREDMLTLRTKGNFGKVVTTCERSWVQASPWGFFFRSEKRVGFILKAKVRVLHTAQLDVTVSSNH
nr:hypothetical protein [Tanacetum cinerariifolium]